MLILDGKTDLNQISLTGVRAIMMIGLLVLAPHSLEEIRAKFLEYKIMDKSHSDDILRIDLNTIKSMGCEISRSSQKTGFKYVLSKHPFALSITDNDIEILRKSFDKIKSSCEISLLIEYDMLLKKISEYICDNDTKEAFLGTSPLLGYNTKLISDLAVDCEYNNTIELMYKKAGLKKPSKKKIIAHKLFLRSNKLYFHGYDLTKNAEIMLNLRNIMEIVSRKLTTEKKEGNDFKVRFYLKDHETYILDNEECISGESDDMMLIEGSYLNDFIAFQRVMSLGSKCIVQEPLEFRNFVISKLKEMRRLYEEKK